MTTPQHTTLDDYQHRASKTAIYPGVGNYAVHAGLTDLERYLPLLYLGLKLAGEAGEVSEKIGKLLRDGIPEGMTEKQWSRLIVKELGDVAWYVSQIARELGYTLEDVALTNLDKLGDRAARGVLGGSGDER